MALALHDSDNAALALAVSMPVTVCRKLPVGNLNFKRFILGGLPVTVRLSHGDAFNLKCVGTRCNKDQVNLPYLNLNDYYRIVCLGSSFPFEYLRSCVCTQASTSSRDLYYISFIF